MKKIISAILLIALSISICVIAPVRTSAETINMSDYLDGVDYTRLTQQAMRILTTFKAVITLADMEFEGALLGSEALTIEEINEVVVAMMNQIHISLPEIKVLSSIGADLERNQRKEIGKKLIVAISEYTQVAGLPGGGALAKQLLYDHSQPQVENRILNVSEDAIWGGIKTKAQERVQNVVNYTVKQSGKVVPPSGAKTGMVGFVFASIDAAQDLLDDSEFDAFCKELDKMYEKVAEFYIRCSQKLNELISEKNRGRNVIKFDPATAYDFNTCKMLGVDGVKMKYTLEGSLVREGDPEEYIDPTDNSGTYKGNLKLIIEGYELDKCFDSVFTDKCDLWQTNYHINDWCQIMYRFAGMPPEYRSEHILTFIPKVNKPTYLKRTLVGEFSVTLKKGAVVGMTPTLKGAFNTVSDGIDFIFEMNIGQEFRAEQWVMKNGMNINLGRPVMQWHLSAFVQGGKSVDAIHVTWVGNEAARSFANGQSVGLVMYSGSGQDMIVPPSDFGTVWKPIERAPNIRFENPY